MQDWQEVAWKRTKAEASVGSLPPGLPATLPDLPKPTPEAPQQGTKRPHDDDNEITELPDGGELAMPPKKKKKKKSKDKPMEGVPALDVPDDGVHPSSSMAEPEVVATKPKQDPAPSGIPEGKTEVPKKKKKKKKDKKEASLEKFREQEREAKAKEMAKVIHRKLQRDQDFWAVRKYRKDIPKALLNTINGADHSGFLLKKLDKENNYMS